MPFPSYRVVLVLAILIAGAVSGAPAEAASLDELRVSGVVQERYDGYVEVRQSNAGSDARALVSDVNAKRRALYEQRAVEQNVPASEVGKLFASQIFQSAPGGTFFKAADGSVIRK